MWSNLPHNTQPASRRCGAWTFTPNPCGDEGRRHRQWGKFRECRQCVLWNYPDVCWNTFLSDRLLTMEANEFVKPLKLVFIIGWIFYFLVANDRSPLNPMNKSRKSYEALEVCHDWKFCCWQQDDWDQEKETSETRKSALLASRSLSLYTCVLSSSSLSLLT